MLDTLEILSRSSTESLVHAFITSRVDYCISLLHGLPKYQLSKFQCVLEAGIFRYFSFHFLQDSSFYLPESKP